MSPALRYTLLWLVGSMVLMFAALGMVGGAYVDGHYIPANADAFYHARRVLDAVMTHAPVIQFDARIHAPEGSWLNWPWGFDTLLKCVTSAFGPYADENAANRILMNIPVAAAPIAVGLFLLLTRQLRLTLGQTLIGVIFFAALPMVTVLFAVGNIDHHFAELLWLLMTLCAMLWFFDARDTLKAGLALGAVLGSANAITNGLFILQLTVLLPFAWRWLRGEGLPGRRAVFAFAITLLAVTVLVCIPSQAWRRGFFEFYTLSWFHAYVALCSAGLVVLMRLLPFGKRNIAIVGGVAVIAALPLLGQVAFGSRFVSGDTEVVNGIIEAYSPYRVYQLFGWQDSTRFTSGLLWLAIPAWLLNVYWAFRARDVRLQVFAVASVLLLGLYQFQYRFGSIGVASLVITILLAARELSERWRERPLVPTLAALLLFVVAYVPCASVWTMNWSKGGDPAYSRIRAVFPPLEQACLERPGIALALVNDAHWITYHTRCSVIGDVFLLTDQHLQKRRETEALYRLTPAELLASRSDIRYVFVRHDVEVGAPLAPGQPEQPDVEDVRRNLSPLARDLLAPAPEIPAQFHLLASTKTPAGRVYSRVYEIVRSEPGS
jgi:hypothetical protein